MFIENIQWIQKIFNRLHHLCACNTILISILLFVICIWSESDTNNTLNGNYNGKCFHNFACHCTAILFHVPLHSDSILIGVTNGGKLWLPTAAMHSTMLFKPDYFEAYVSCETTANLSRAKVPLNFTL